MHYFHFRIKLIAELNVYSILESLQNDELLEALQTTEANGRREKKGV